MMAGAEVSKEIRDAVRKLSKDPGVLSQDGMVLLKSNQFRAVFMTLQKFHSEDPETLLLPMSFLEEEPEAALKLLEHVWMMMVE